MKEAKKQHNSPRNRYVDILPCESELILEPVSLLVDRGRERETAHKWFCFTLPLTITLQTARSQSRSTKVLYTIKIPQHQQCRNNK